MNKRWDIFCHVVDNYGDAGVCWRLARQLADEFELAVRLWIDDLTALKKIHPQLDLSRAQQCCAGVTICQWTQPMPQPLQAADVVIEAFACNVPDEYCTAMHAQRSLWINLEYLSAEDWVSGCHGLPSQVDSALKKYFFFPGFQRGTGGVLGEHDLPQRRNAFQADAAFQSGANGIADFFQRFGVAPSPAALRVSLFSYRYAPIENLLRVWSAQAQPIICFVPEGQPLAAVSHLFGEELPVGSIRKIGSLTVVVLPFLSQDDYDRLLWGCDINFVRGEDSFVRAQWAARPFVWQIYAQEEGAHLPKLDAFMAEYLEWDRESSYGEQMSPSAAAALSNFWRAWNRGGAVDEKEVASAWSAYIKAMPELRVAAKKWAERLESGTNLATALVQFCANQV